MTKFNREKKGEDQPDLLHLLVPGGHKAERVAVSARSTTSSAAPGGITKREAMLQVSEEGTCESQLLLAGQVCKVRGRPRVCLLCGYRDRFPAIAAGMCRVRQIGPPCQLFRLYRIFHQPHRLIPVLLLQHVASLGQLVKYARTRSVEYMGNVNPWTLPQFFGKMQSSLSGIKVHRWSTISEICCN